MLPVASVIAGTAYASATAGFGYRISLVGGLLLLIAGPLVFMDNKKMTAAPVMAPPPPA